MGARVAQAQAPASAMTLGRHVNGTRESARQRAQHAAVRLICGPWGLALMALVLALGTTLLAVRDEQATPPAPQRSLPSSALRLHSAPLPEAATPALMSAEARIDQEIRRLGRREPTYLDDLRRDYDEAEDLYGFVLGALAPAQAGDGASQYHIYLALEECHAYLRADADQAQAWFIEAVTLVGSTEGLQRLERHDRRCRGFAGADLAPLAAALGPVPPGSPAEYAALWFERAVDSGYPPARVNWALRPTWTRSQRLALLEPAVATPDPVVYWQLFAAEAAFLEPTEVPLRSLAWLILACRSGMDCRAHADWYRAWACPDVDTSGAAACPTESAIERYWLARSEEERRLAYTLADMLQARQRVLAFEVLPGLGDGEARPRNVSQASTRELRAGGG